MPITSCPIAWHPWDKTWLHPLGSSSLQMVLRNAWSCSVTGPLASIQAQWCHDLLKSKELCTVAEHWVGLLGPRVVLCVQNARAMKVLVAECSLSLSWISIRLFGFTQQTLFERQFLLQSMQALLLADGIWWTAHS